MKINITLILGFLVFVYLSEAIVNEGPSFCQGVDRNKTCEDATGGQVVGFWQNKTGRTTYKGYKTYKTGCAACSLPQYNYFYKVTFCSAAFKSGRCQRTPVVVPTNDTTNGTIPEPPGEEVPEEVPEETPEETPEENPGEETPGEEVPPGEETPGEEVPGEETPGEETPGEEVPGEETPGEEVPGEETPGEEVPGEETPGEEVPGEETPGEETPEEETPGEETPAEEEEEEEVPETTTTTTESTTTVTTVVTTTENGFTRKVNYTSIDYNNGTQIFINTTIINPAETLQFTSTGEPSLLAALAQLDEGDEDDIPACGLYKAGPIQNFADECDACNTDGIIAFFAGDCPPF